MRRTSVVLALVAMLAAMGALPGRAQTSSSTTKVTKYLVLYAEGASLADARAAVKAAGGTIVRENTAVGLATVRSSNANFMRDAARQRALEGAARNRVLGRAPATPKVDRVESFRHYGDLGSRQPATHEDDGDNSDPLSGLQWGNEAVDADDEGSYAVQKGDPGVMVATIDTGVDGSHPDIAPQFNAELSRNFTTDIPLVDGPCEEEPDQSCEDPNDVDENGHGTHTGGTMAAALNGLGVAGIAPNVQLLNLRAGQDSGYFFLQETVDALTYAGDIGVDVVNMSFFIDPWLYNCPNHPDDSEAEQREQRIIIRATQRALTYAHNHGVTLVGSAGNQDDDLTDPSKKDFISPDFPPGVEKHRIVDESCLSLPAEGKYVITVSALGPELAKSYFSNYGYSPEGEGIDVSAPGGDRRWYYGTPAYNAPENRILSTYPESAAREQGLIDEFGNPLTPLVVRNCANGKCGYYAYLQGTSMSGPHAAGVAALIVSEFGVPDGEHGGLTASPAMVRDILYASAVDHACPTPRRFVHPDPTLPAQYNAFCEGGTEYNGFYGHGIVNALNAVTFGGGGA